MSVTQYLDLAYAVAVDDRVRRGVSLLDALESTQEWAARSDLGFLEVKVAPAGGNTYQSSEPERPRVDPGGPGAPVSRREMQEAEAVSAFMTQLGGGKGVG